MISSTPRHCWKSGLVTLFGSAVQTIPVTIVPGNFADEQIDSLA
jgi:hypothetical protein